MRKWIPYIALGVVVMVLLALLVTRTPARQKNRRLDERITLKQRDKIPYGYYAALQLLPDLFPEADISTDKSEPGYWQSISTAGSNQAVFLIAKSFEPEEYELKRLADFVRKGNYVFIIAKSLSFEASRFFKVNDETEDLYFNAPDSMQATLSSPPFSTPGPYIYPGKSWESYFQTIGVNQTVTLGTNESGAANFIQLEAGSGKLFVHLSPLVFSNFFLLHKNNIAYYQQALSVIPPHVDVVLWNEYFLTKKKSQDDSDPSLLRVLWQHPAFRWALITAMATLLLYVLMEMRRRQRPIPLWTRPANDSLDFVRTMGRLYYDRGDHQNLARKMGVHFLEHIKTRYKINTTALDTDFIQTLHGKSGYPLDKLESLVSFIYFVNAGEGITDAQLADLHQQLEKYYQTT